MDFAATLTGFLESTRDARGEDPRLNQLGPQLIELAKGLSKPQLDAALTSLTSAFSAPHPQVAAFAALIGGCLVEDGAEPGILVSAVLPCLDRALPLASEALEVAASLPQVAPAKGATRTLGEHTISQRDFEQLLETRTPHVQSLLAVDQFCQPLIAALSRAPQLLKTPLVQLLGVPLSAVIEASQFAHFLARLLRVPMNETWWLIDARSGRGFELRVSGVASAFQVYALVHAALPQQLGASPAPSNDVRNVAEGNGPQAIAASYTPPFTLFRWPAIKRAGYVPSSEDTREWYSNSAVPAELAWFGDVRVAVVGSSAIKMELRASREFGGLKAQIALVKELERDRVAELLAAFAKTPHPGHPVPGVGWP